MTMMAANDLIGTWRKWKVPHTHYGLIPLRVSRDSSIENNGTVRAVWVNGHSLAWKVAALQSLTVPATPREVREAKLATLPTEQRQRVRVHEWGVSVDGVWLNGGGIAAAWWDRIDAAVCPDIDAMLIVLDAALAKLPSEPTVLRSRQCNCDESIALRAQLAAVTAELQDYAFRHAMARRT